MSETELIERIQRLAGGISAGGTLSVVKGIGDDCAVIEVGRHTLLLTVDMLLEGVHFRVDWIDARSLGWKSLAVNLSDIAGMGGTPACALLSLAIPAHLTGEWFDSFIAGVVECAQTYGCALIGGDTNRSETVVIDITVLGTVEGAPVLRSTAQPGDWLMVTGALGGSRAGLYALIAGETDGIDLTSHFRPIPRLWEGQIARALGVNAMMDISDGLSADLPKLLKASGVGAVVRLSAIPVHPIARQWAVQHHEDPAIFALQGGEDYELLITAPPDIAERLIAKAEIPITRIGEVIEDPYLWLETETGEKVSWTFQGWDHFNA